MMIAHSPVGCEFIAKNKPVIFYINRFNRFTNLNQILCQKTKQASSLSTFEIIHVTNSIKMPYEKVVKFKTTVTYSVIWNVHEVDLLNGGFQDGSKVILDYNIRTECEISYQWHDEDRIPVVPTQPENRIIEIPNGGMYTSERREIDRSVYNPRSLEQANERLRLIIQLGRASVAATKRLNKQMQRQADMQYNDHLTANDGTIFIPRF